GWAGRPGRRPWASPPPPKISRASSADLPFGPRPPVSAMLEPILIGGPDWAAALAAARYTATSNAAPASRRWRIIWIPPSSIVKFAESYDQPWRRRQRLRGELSYLEFDHSGTALGATVAFRHRRLSGPYRPSIGPILRAR